MISTELKFKVHDLITNRFSPRNFHPRAIEPEALHSILEAGRLAPSSYPATK